MAGPADQSGIRPVRSGADLAATVTLFRAYAESLGIDLAYQDFAGELAAMPGKYRPPAGELLLAHGGRGEALGCIGLRPLTDEGCCEIKRLYVVPAGRGQGVGRGLLVAILAKAGRIGYREVRLDTLPGMNAALALYREAGFAPIDPYYDSPVPGTVFLGRRLAVEADAPGRSEAG